MPESYSSLRSGFPEWIAHNKRIHLLELSFIVPTASYTVLQGCEESGSKDLPYYIQQQIEKIGKPSLVVCLDSGCGNYEQMWLTTSLRGCLVGDLRVDIVKEGLHRFSRLHERIRIVFNLTQAYFVKLQLVSVCAVVSSRLRFAFSARCCIVWKTIRPVLLGSAVAYLVCM